MSHKQRAKNRMTARHLEQGNRAKRNLSHTCENCGKPGGHWVQVRGMSVEGIVSGVDDSVGFYSCPTLILQDLINREWLRQGL